MWAGIKKFFKDSEVLFWARLQAFLGIAAVTLTYVQPSVLEPLFTPQGFSYFLVVNGVATEYLRRRRDEEMK